MKCNVRELAHLSDQPCVIEGRLNYKKISNGGYRNQAVFKERWFRLINNYLFYFKISEMGKFDTKNPAGVFVMENSSIQMEHGPNISFSFSISFIDEPEKRHVFAARAEDNVVQWVIKLRECSYEYLRERLHTLQSKIYSITGKDPLLLVPRNEGACLWAPAVPFSTAPACTVNTSSFSCHLHTAGAFTLERSKSDANTHRHLRTTNATFYTDEPSDGHKSDTKVFSLERSKTSSLFKSQIESLEGSIFDNGKSIASCAPSPPARNRLCPAGTGPARRGAGADVRALADSGRLLGAAAAGILGDAPVPPRRKVSPKPAHLNSDTGRSQDTEDLIQF
ncbi:uncharacterized protein LOC125225313 [Leguminivora glycinivorella]|uniref:uncharacterized protein LOC125225313 n=1 Tax=Leguminivora glycinivorella TaxID=1035111 RepID=UPI00200D0178|nr:uncharacterized protein LOC125225313 [Leguminivora glycinivorella]